MKHANTTAVNNPPALTRYQPGLKHLRSYQHRHALFGSRMTDAQLLKTAQTHPRAWRYGRRSERA